MAKATLRLPRKPRLSKPVREWLAFNRQAHAEAEAAFAERPLGSAGTDWSKLTRAQKRARQERMHRGAEARASSERRAEELVRRMEKHGHTNALDIAVLALHYSAAARALVVLVLRKYGMITDDLKYVPPEGA
jgi:hypothetical protein